MVVPFLGWGVSWHSSGCFAIGEGWKAAKNRGQRKDVCEAVLFVTLTNPLVTSTTKPIASIYPSSVTQSIPSSHSYSWDMVGSIFLGTRIRYYKG